MISRISIWINVGLVAGVLNIQPSELVNGRPSLVFENERAKLIVDLSGGSIGDFHFKDQSLNPLHWAAPDSGDTGIRGFGHFLCLDRWGPPSEAEGANGMPYHGEASRVGWTVVKEPSRKADSVNAVMTADLPLAGLSISRFVRLSNTETFFVVQEEITNQNKLGRVYNAVQHPTIAPPFLDETTLVDSNGRRGFAQGGSLPFPEEPSFDWPQALKGNGAAVNMRHLVDDPNPNVVSYTIDDEFGWVTAATPRKGLLIGYIWRTRDYPWVSLWRNSQNGEPAARGLEFGTTGLHQPFPVLTRKGRIFGRPLFEYLDAGETATKSYACFLFRIPDDYAGVGRITVENNRLIVSERSTARPRDLLLNTGGLLAP